MRCLLYALRALTHSRARQRQGGAEGRPSRDQGDDGDNGDDGWCGQDSGIAMQGGMLA